MMKSSSIFRLTCFCDCFIDICHISWSYRSHEFIFYCLFIHFFAIGKQKGDKIAGYFVLCTQHCLEGLIWKGEQ